MVYTLVVQFRAKEGKDVEEKIRNKLIEASQTYMKDAEVVGWHVMQDHVDPRKWAIIERYERESSLKIHQANPYYAEFSVYMEPLTEQADVFQFNELDTSEPEHTQ
ncbi:putative antibiotic biosynthesis monooxygenase protein [Phytophthora cinnamomi]|uniref:putative antibiotic biosynthesis monooxygenase protein n=1 Tax=Phytophthora cinnamomi TaxID=4785 RepID=UPI00355A8E17|nr:putative antibiotic biosynthesis monooxygenase protein [Phytophthora cinnamomi]KAG6572784.1 putative antibiotic biosynthesis monooxygenase protein [Phytophthora cinnamomi]KAG6572891.1 putative antibiotic biosynthesis monooxygenase protein [Phytophthora cinnamomi]